jgi:two-component system chemotaxis response regulator CheB
LKQEIINILIADDSGFMRLMVKQMLQENEHFKVIDSATNGKEAFEKTQSLRPDVVVLDMLMAEYDGLYAVKNIMKYCPTPIILLTSLNVAQSSQVFEALQLGAFDFVSKPLGVFSSKIRTVQDL